MAIYRGAGGSGDAVGDASSEVLLALQAKDAAIAAQANYFSISFIQISIFAGIVGKFITNFTTNE